MITTAILTPKDLVVRELSMNEVEIGDKILPNQLQRRSVGLTTFRDLVDEIDLDSIRESPFYNLIIEGVRLHERFLADTRRSLVTEVFSHGYSTVTEIVQRFDQFGFKLEGPLPPDAYTSTNHLNINTYPEMYFEEASVVSIATNMTELSSPDPAASNAPLRLLDMSEVTNATFENINDKIRIGRVTVTGTEMEEYITSHTEITTEVVDYFDSLHQKMVKIMYYYKTLVLPAANLEELHHLQSLQVLLTQEMCDLGEGLRTEKWFKARTRAPALSADLHDNTPGAQCIIRLTGLPDIVVLTAPLADAVPDSMITDKTGSISVMTRQLADIQFLARVKLIMESKFAAFNSGSTRVSNKLNRSTKLQLCCYSIAVRQMYRPDNSDALKAFPLLLSDGLSGQLLMHSPPAQGRNNLFRCLPRSTTSRQYVVQTLLGLFADPADLHAWMLAHEKHVHTRSQGKANGGRGAGSTEDAQSNNAGAANYHATHSTTSAEYLSEQSADSDLSDDEEPEVPEEPYDDEQDCERYMVDDDESDYAPLPAWLTETRARWVI